MFSTPEMRINCSDKMKFEVVKDLEKSLVKNKSNINKVDGLRVNMRNGWWLLRASNTQEALIVRIEANTQKDLEEMQLEIENYIKKYDLSISQ